ncbi:MAG: S41 family peptidase [Patescibacteria group bacterium]
MKKTKNIFFSLSFAVLLLIPCLASAGNFKAGDLVKLENSSSIYQIQADGTRLVFPTASVYKSYYDNFDNIKTANFDEIKNYPPKGNVPLKVGSLVKFDYNNKVYEVKPNSELEWIKSEEGFKKLGYDFEKVVSLPEIFWNDYQARKTDGSYNEVAARIKSDFIDKTKSENIENTASSSRGLLEALGDEYSVFWTAEEYKKFANWLDDDSFEGIGAEIEIRDRQLTIVAPLNGSPAEAAGLKAGDKVKFINNLDTTGIGLNDALMNIRGTKGTEVILSVEREGASKIILIPIIRGTIVVDQFSWEIKQTLLGREAAYLSLSQFSLNGWEDFTKSKDEILKADPQGIILDLRNNPGGYLEMALDVASRWLESGDLILVERRANNIEVRRVANDHNYYNKIPLVILVNKGSASASEIVAGALKDHGAATIVGGKTFGKGVVQEIVPLSDGNVIKLTVSEWLTPNGDHINGIGITADVLIDNVDNKTDLQLEAGLEKMDELISNRFLVN